MYKHKIGVPSPLIHEHCGIHGMEIKPSLYHIKDVNVLRNWHPFIPSCRQTLKEY